MLAVTLGLGRSVRRTISSRLRGAVGKSGENGAFHVVEAGREGVGGGGADGAEVFQDVVEGLHERDARTDQVVGALAEGRPRCRPRGRFSAGSVWVGC